MEDWLIFISAGLLVLFQLLSCIFAKKALVRWLPFLVSAVLTVFCFAMYFGSNQTNWGYIILIALLGVVLLLQGAIIFVNRLIRWIIKL